MWSPKTGLRSGNEVLSCSAERAPNGLKLKTAHATRREKWDLVMGVLSLYSCPPISGRWASWGRWYDRRCAGEMQGHRRRAQFRSEEIQWSRGPSFPGAE